MATRFEALDVQPADLFTFLAIVRCGSLTGAARQLEVTPSQVSKAVARLERQLGAALLVRGTRGIEVTAAGRRVVPAFDEILARLRSLRSPGERPQPLLTIVAASFLSAFFLPHILNCLPPIQIRSLELPPGIANAYASQSLFDIALTTVDEPWPSSWVKVAVGVVRRGLFASPHQASQLGPQPVSSSRLRDASFIGPVYSYQGNIFLGDDGCPLPKSERGAGHETQTVSLALQIAQATGQLVFAPAIAARPWVERGLLTEIAVKGWNVTEPLYLVCHGERVRSKVQRAILGALRAALGA